MMKSQKAFIANVRHSAQAGIQLFQYILDAGRVIAKLKSED